MVQQVWHEEALAWSSEPFEWFDEEGVSDDEQDDNRPPRRMPLIMEMPPMSEIMRGCSAEYIVDSLSNVYTEDQLRKLIDEVKELENMPAEGKKTGPAEEVA
mmetsp:Transcript_1847/g.4135  ORF Transcript_1847/g.4135 Transcript_1847/m.4135 type:complete len:102 (-) Transcript_1847:137-442(-)